MGIVFLEELVYFSPRRPPTAAAPNRAIHSCGAAQREMRAKTSVVHILCAKVVNSGAICLLEALTLLNTMKKGDPIDFEKFPSTLCQNRSG